MVGFKLKPCPFCGSKDVRVDEYYYVSDGSTGYCVTCYKCGIGTPERESRKKVIRAWNRRTV